jgi:hypothetical protein
MKKQRTKLRTDIWNVKTLVGGSQTGNNDYSEISTELDAVIASGSGRKRYNVCSHMVYRLKPQKVNWVDDFGSMKQYYSSVPPLAFKQCPAITETLVPDGFVGRSYQAMRPKVKSEASILNFLFELKDIKQMFTSFYSMSTELTKLVKAHKRDSLKDVAASYSRLGAESNLGFQFAIRPLVDDIKTLSNLVHDYDKRMEQLRSELGRIQVSHYSEKRTVAGSEQHSLGSINDWVMTIDACEIVNTATMKYRYQLSPGVALPSGLQSLPAFAGMRWSPKFVWDAIPYSFAVDWVLKIGDWLDQFDSGAIPVDIEILDYCVSSKYLRKANFRLDSRNLTVRPETRLNLGSASVACYQRQPIAPAIVRSAVSLPKTDGLSVRELLLASSLVVMKR